jgi:hypothetical protein
MDGSVDLSDELRETSGSSLTDFLFPAPAPRTVGGIVRWWESRRLHYNVIVGGAGFLTLGIVNLVASLPPNPHSIGFFWGPVIAYGLLANACYLLGPIAEIAVEKLSRGKILPTGPSLFRMGLTFSVGLTLLPVLLILFDWIIRILTFVF